MQLFRIAVLGPGGVGGSVAAILWKAGHDVTVIGRKETIERIRTRGFSFESPTLGVFTVRPRAKTRLDAKPDVLFIATKAYGLADAMERIPRHCVRNSIIIPLLNGIEHVAVIRNTLGPRVAPGAISIEAVSDANGTIRQLSPFIKIRMASDTDVPPLELERIASSLSEAGIETEVGSSEQDVLWGKVVRLNAITLVVAASGRPIGEARGNKKWRAVLRSCVEETVRVASVEGAVYNADQVMAAIDALPPTLITSLARDVMRGAKNELDAIAGAVIRAGARHGIACPTISQLVERI